MRAVLDRGTVEPLPILNMPGVEGLKVGVPDVPKLRVGVADGAAKLNPTDAENKEYILIFLYIYKLKL